MDLIYAINKFNVYFCFFVERESAAKEKTDQVKKALGKK